MKRYEKLESAWKMFAESGSVGAYLMYCAMRRAERESERDE